MMVKQQRGVALLMAILIVALATMLAVSVATEGYMDQRRTSIMMSLDEAAALGQGAEGLAADALLEDAKNSQTDSPDESWATPVQLPVDDGAGMIEGQLEDLQGRFNLNNLLADDGSIDEAAVSQFERLLELLELDKKWARILVDWIDADNEAQFPDGAEDIVYGSQTPSYLTPNMPITRPSELLSLFQMDAKTYRTLEPYIAALPIGTPLNVCTASGYVLDSLSSNTDEYSKTGNTLQQNRESGCFPGLTELDKTLANDTAYQQLKEAGLLEEKSSYFQADLHITFGSTDVLLYSTLYRGQDGRSRIIQRSLGTT